MKKLIISIIFFIWLIHLPNNAISQWEKIMQLPYKAHCSDIQMASDNSIWTLFGTYSQQYVLKSRDQGKTWNYYKIPYTGINDFYNNNVWCIAPVDSLTAYVSIFKVGIIKTTDAGRTWNLINNQAKNTFMMHFFNKNEGIIVEVYFKIYGVCSPEDSAVIYKTYDGGVTLQKIELAGNEDFLSTVNISNNSSLQISGDTLAFPTLMGRIFMSFNRGNNWKTFYSGLGKDEALIAMAMKNSKSFIVVGQESRGFQRYGVISRIRLSATNDGGITWQNNLCTPFNVASIHYLPNTESTYLLANYSDYIGAMISTDQGQNFSAIDLHHTFSNMRFFSPELAFASTNEAGEDANCLMKWNNSYTIKDPYPQYLSGNATIDTFHAGYRLYVPKDEDVNKKFPLLLFFHGHGIEGCDNMKQLIGNYLTDTFSGNFFQKKYPCFLLVPQKTLDIDTATLANDMFLRIVNKIVDSLILQYPSVDTNRIYVMGVSMGAYLTWDMIRMFPNQFAASVPVAGGFQDKSVESILHVPMWDFQGEVDYMVLHEWAEQLMDKFISYKRKPFFTNDFYRQQFSVPDSVIESQICSHQDLFFSLYPNEAHGVGRTVIKNQLFFKWLFKQYKAVPNSIKLQSFGSSYSGNIDIKWTSDFTNDSVEIWFSPDNGYYWLPITTAYPNTGSYSWKTENMGDCGMGLVKILLKDKNGFIYGWDKSSAFAVNNGINGKPYLYISDTIINRQDSLKLNDIDLKPIIADAENSQLAVKVFCMNKNVYSLIKEYMTYPSIEPQSCSINLVSLPMKNLRLKISVIDGDYIVSDSTLVFMNLNGKGTGVLNKHDKYKFLLNIFPNPSKDKIQFVSYENSLYPSQLSIFDPTGRLILSRTLPATRQGEEISIDLSDHASGMYLVKLNSGGKVYYGKVMLIK